MNYLFDCYIQATFDVGCYGEEIFNVRCGTDPMPAPLSSLAENRVRAIIKKVNLDRTVSYVNDATLYGALCEQSSIATITAATNATPIVITTAAAHGLVTGDKVIIYEVVGNHAANGHFTVTVIDATSFSLNGSVGSGAFVASGARAVYKPLNGLDNIAFTYTPASNGEYTAILASNAPIVGGTTYRMFLWDTGTYADKFFEYQDFRAQ